MHSMLLDLVRSMPHPTWERFSETLDENVSVLLIHAPEGSGADWFAQCWRPGESRKTTWLTKDSYPQSPETLALQSHSSPSPSTLSVLFVESTRFSWDLLVGVPWAMIRTADLLLSQEEIANLLAAVAPSRQHQVPPEAGTAHIEGARRIYELTGGWLEPTLSLIQDPADTERAAAIMLPFVTDWVGRIEDGPAMALAAHLSSITAETLSSLFHQIPYGSTSVDAMVTAGVLREDDTGDYFLPTLLRQCLKRLVQQENAPSTEILAEAALKALVESEGLETALETAQKTRKWPALARLLGDHWPELFTSDARRIKRLLSLLPHPIVVRAFGDVAGVAIRMAMGAGADRMSFLLPSTEPHYPSDPVAQRLRSRSEKLALTPDYQALTIGLLELGHLRFTGHYTYSEEAASRLRVTLDRATGLHPVRPLLASVVELQSGISLHIGGNYLEAKRAYEAALYWANGAENTFQHANATGNLALIAAQAGYTQQAREWLAQHDQTIHHVGWGRAMVARGAELARVLNALTALDLETADAILESLPPEPDTDEFWSAHAYTLALRDILTGRSHEAMASTTYLRKERPYASQSALAEQLLDLADHIAQLHSPIRDPNTPGSTRSLGEHQSRFFEVLHRLLIGDARTAQTLLQAIPLSQMGPRWRNITISLYDLFNIDPPLGAPTSLIDDVIRGSAELIDLVIPYLSGSLEQTGDLNRLSPEQQQRLSNLPSVTLQRAARPQLTARENSVLHQLRLGKNRKEIAESEHLSENTVKSQLRSLYRKLRANSLEEALESARRWGY